MTPSVCVLLSTYNGSAFLEAQLESLRRQSGVQVDLHARDDGSTDGTVALLHNYAGTWPSLAELEPGENLGPAMSFLELLRTAPDAEFYAFCDQDDVWLPDKLARAVEVLSRDEGPTLYCSNVTCVAEDLKMLGTPRENGDTRLQHLLFENIAYGCTTVMNRAARSLIVGRLPEQGVVMHDWWCALVVGALGRIHYDPEPRILYRQHSANSYGAHAGVIGQAIANAARFLRRPDGFYPVHAQASELLRLYQDVLQPVAYRTIATLVESRRTWRTRFRYAAGGGILRNRTIDGVIVRGLILMNWY